jgi:hypothetical protein
MRRRKRKRMSWMHVSQGTFFLRGGTTWPLMNMASTDLHNFLNYEQVTEKKERVL